MGLLRRKPGEPFNPMQVRSPIANIGQVVYWLQQLHEEQKRTNELLEELVARGGETPPDPYAPERHLRDRNAPNPYVPRPPRDPAAPNPHASNPYAPEPAPTRRDRDEPNREPRGR